MSLKPLAFDITRYRYNVMIGTGGVGSGSFFKLDIHSVARKAELDVSSTGRITASCTLFLITSKFFWVQGSRFSRLPRSAMTILANACFSKWKRPGWISVTWERHRGSQRFFRSASFIQMAAVDAAFIKKLDRELLCDIATKNQFPLYPDLQNLI